MKLLDYHQLHRNEKQSWNLQVLEQRALEQDGAFLERVSPLLPDDQEHFSGDLIALDRGSLFQKLARLCQLYRGATAEQRTWLRSRIDAGRRAQLESFGLRAAVAGARDHAAATVGLGLAAFALADIGNDVREVLLSLAVVLRCAQLCGNAVTMFQAAAGLSGPAMSAALLDFAGRPADLQTLAVMGWHEVKTPDGPGYRFGSAPQTTNP